MADLMFQVVPPCGGHPASTMCAELLGSFKSCPRVGGIINHAWICLQAKFQVVPPCGGHL